MPKLHVIEGPQKGQTIEFSQDTVFVGRSSTNDLQIADSSISRKHLKLFRLENLCFVEDLKSTNGTLVNGKPIEPGEGVQVQEGDTISIGTTTIRLDAISEDEVIAIKDLAPPTTERGLDLETPLSEERRSRTLKELELISKVSELIQEPLEIEQVLEKVLRLLLDSLPRIDRAAIFLVDNEKDQIKKRMTKSRQGPPDDAAPFRQAILDLVLQDGEALKMSMETHDEPAPFSEASGTLKIKSVMCVPMRSSSKLRGLIYVEGLQEHQAFREEDLLLLKSLGAFLALAIESAQLASK